MQKEMPALNLPAFELHTKTEQGRAMIFDFIRKKYVVLTPEEWVRQHFLHYLTDHLKYPASLIHVEASLLLNRLKKRCDAVVYNRHAAAAVILEFKAPHITLSRDTFDQAARYNLGLGVRFLILSNGLEHYCCRMFGDSGTYEFMETLPAFDELQD